MGNMVTALVIFPCLRQAYGPTGRCLSLTAVIPLTLQLSNGLMLFHSGLSNNSRTHEYGLKWEKGLCRSNEAHETTLA